jgi:hypothetical protein
MMNLEKVCFLGYSYLFCYLFIFFWLSTLHKCTGSNHFLVALFINKHEHICILIIAYIISSCWLLPFLPFLSSIFSLLSERVNGYWIGQWWQRHISRRISYIDFTAWPLLSACLSASSHRPICSMCTICRYTENATALLPSPSLNMWCVDLLWYVWAV